MAKYKLAIFDMDGTILNTIDDLADGVNYALKTAGMPTRTVDYVRSIVGNGILTTLKLCAPEGISDEKIAELHTYFAPYYEQHRTDKTRAYAGIAELLEKIRALGIKTAVVSNKNDVSVKPLAAQYFPGLFDMALGVGEGRSKKPAPDMPDIIIKNFGFDKKDVVYIGDSEVDIMTAQNTGIDCISVTWGFRGRERLEKLGAKVIADNCDEVLKLILG